jgi:hypothetical protein
VRQGYSYGQQQHQVRQAHQYEQSQPR